MQDTTKLEYKIPVIVLCHNSLESTVKMVKSLYDTTNTGIFDLYIVNNQSSDGTKEYFQYLAKQYTNVFVFEPEVNLGFAGGMNYVFNHLKTKNIPFEYLVQLNNDVIVTPGWLKSMVTCIGSQDNVVLVGPVSNHVMEHQLIRGCNLKSNANMYIYSFGDQYKKQFKGNKYTQEGIISGFCMLMKKEMFDIIDKFGFYPTEFTMYDDNFTCLLAQRFGYKILVDRSTFIYHEGSATFRQQNIDYKTFLFDNQLKFFKYWLEKVEPVLNQQVISVIKENN